MQYKQTNKFMKTILDEKTICDEYQSTKTRPSAAWSYVNISQSSFPICYGFPVIP